MLSFPFPVESVEACASQNEQAGDCSVAAMAWFHQGRDTDFFRAASAQAKARALPCMEQLCTC